MNRLALVALACMACGTPPVALPPAPPPAPAAPAEIAVAGRPTAGLPDTVVPRAYELELELSPGSRRFAGRVEIAIELREPASSVWLNASALELRRAELVHGGRVTPLAPLPGSSDGFIGFGFGRTLPAGAAALRLTFDGRFGDRTGLFRQRHHGRHYLFSDFEPRDARHAFPCFDDPRFKATWTVHLVVPEGVDALSNMPAVDTRPTADGRERVTFAPTPPLPSYLVAVAAGDFERVEVAGMPVPTGIVVPSGTAARAAEAAAFLPGLYAAVTERIAVPMPFPKLDFIAVPHLNGAMENPGLITVALPILLTHPDEPVTQSRLRALVLAHELAHLWFGDWVTPRTWRDLWLNEGFATWLTDVALARWRPARQTRLDEVIARDDAMHVDRRAGVRAIREVEHDGGEEVAAFDVLTYKKAGALLTMVEDWLGARVFAAGVHGYLHAGNGGSVDTEMLLRALAEHTEEPVSAVLRSFLDQGGFPLLSIAHTCAGEELRLELAQERYLTTGERARVDAAEGGRRFVVPVCVTWPRQSGMARACTVLDEARQTWSVALDGASCPSWVHPNADASGYYRWDVPDETLMALAASDALSPRQRVELPGNLRALLLSGDLAPRTALAALAAADPTASDRAAISAAALIADIAHQLVDDAERSALGAYAERVFGDRIRALGSARRPDEPDTATELRRALLLDIGVATGAPSAVRLARAAAPALLAGDSPIDPATAGPLLATAARADARLIPRYRRALDAALAADDEDRAAALIEGLTGARGAELAPTVAWIARARSRGTLPPSLAYAAIVRLLASDAGERVIDLLADAAARGQRHRELLAAPFDEEARCVDRDGDRREQLARALVGESSTMVELLDEAAKNAALCLEPAGEPIVPR